MNNATNYFVISDTHFRHENISKYTGRPFKTVEEMDASLIKKWNTVVRQQDLIIIGGDLVFTKGSSEEIKKIIKQLNGRKILVRGNHCRKSYSFWLNAGIDFVCERFSWELNGKKLLFIHSPHEITFQDYKSYNYILHGHIHQKGNFISWKNKCCLINICVEKTNYSPINLITLLNKLQQGYYNNRKEM